MLHGPLHILKSRKSRDFNAKIEGFRLFCGFSRLLRVFKMYSGQCNTLHSVQHIWTQCALSFQHRMLMWEIQDRGHGVPEWSRAMLKANVGNRACLQIEKKKHTPCSLASELEELSSQAERAVLRSKNIPVIRK